MLGEEELELFELAFLLHSPLYVILEEMSYQEYLGWCHYFQKRPIGWREDNRAYMIMTSMGCKVAPEKIFESLKKMKEQEGPRNGLQSSQLFRMLVSATGGDKLSFMESNG